MCGLFQFDSCKCLQQFTTPFAKISKTTHDSFWFLSSPKLPSLCHLISGLRGGLFSPHFFDVHSASLTSRIYSLCSLVCGATTGIVILSTDCSAVATIFLLLRYRLFSARHRLSSIYVFAIVFVVVVSAISVLLRAHNQHSPPPPHQYARARVLWGFP